MQARPPQYPHKPRPSEAYLLRVDTLRQWRKRTARAMGVESDVIMPKDLLYQIAEHNPKSRAQVDEILASVPWRKQRFAEQIYSLLNSR